MKRYWISICTALLVAACSSDDEGPGGTGDGGSAVAGDGSGAGGGGAGSSGASGSGSGTSGAGGSTSGAGGGGGTSGGGTGGSATPVDGGTTGSGTLDLCNGEPCECADGIDNDGDGNIDGFDVECTGPADDREDSFWTGISGDNKDPKWQDCFFDGNSGAPRQTDCRYHTDCLTGAKDQSDPDCQVTQGCLDFCQPSTPNGCDCFGCCEVTVGGVVHLVLTSSDCNADNIDTCQTCIQTASDCKNECGECELCPGKTVDDLPASCSSEPPPTGGSGGSGSAGTGGAGGTGGSGSAGTGGMGSGGTGGGGTPYTCDDLVPTCTVQGDCPTGRYCSQGCCILIGPS